MRQHGIISDRNRKAQKLSGEARPFPYPTATTPCQQPESSSPRSAALVTALDIPLFQGLSDILTPLTAQTPERAVRRMQIFIWVCVPI